MSLEPFSTERPLAVQQDSRALSSGQRAILQDGRSLSSAGADGRSCGTFLQGAHRSHRGWAPAAASLRGPWRPGEGGSFGGGLVAEIPAVASVRVLRLWASL